MKLKTRISKIYVIEVYSDEVCGTLKKGFSVGTKKRAEEWGKHMIEETKKDIESGKITFQTLTAGKARQEA